MYYGTTCAALLVWATSNRLRITKGLRSVGLRTASKLADAVDNHQPSAVERGLDFLLDADSQERLRVTEAETAAVQAAYQARRQWELTLCSSALVLHGAPAACLGTDRQTAMTVEPLPLGRSDKAARALMVAIAVGAGLPELAGLRIGLVRAMQRYTPQPSPRIVARQCWVHQHGAVRYYQDSTAAKPTPTVEPSPAMMIVAMQRGGYNLWPTPYQAVAPNDPRDVVLTSSRPDWGAQYPEMYRDTMPTVESRFDVWMRRKLTRLVIQDFCQAPVAETVATAGAVEHAPIEDFQDTAMECLEYLDALMDGPTILAEQAGDVALDLTAACRRGWSHFDTRQVVHGAVHFIALECKRLKRWGPVADDAETSLAAMGCVPRDIRLVTGLRTVSDNRPCELRKCQRAADYWIGKHPYCKPHTLERQATKENTHA